MLSPMFFAQNYNREGLGYGYLYNWYAASDANFAHISMRVPTKSDLDTLLLTVLDDYGDLKEIGTDHWNSPNSNATNTSGLTLFGSGIRDNIGNFGLFRSDARLWTTTLESGVLYYSLNVSENQFADDFTPQTKEWASSVRMVSDTNPGATITDYDGNIYDVVQIGTQYWTVQNWKCEHYNDGTLIPTVTDNTAWSNLTTGAKCVYDNDINNL